MGYLGIEKGGWRVEVRRLREFNFSFIWMSLNPSVTFIKFLPFLNPVLQNVRTKTFHSIQFLLHYSSHGYQSHEPVTWVQKYDLHFNFFFILLPILIVEFSRSKTIAVSNYHDNHRRPFELWSIWMRNLHQMWIKNFSECWRSLI